MTPSFSLHTTPRYERLARALLKTHPEFLALQERAFEVLTADPYNRTRGHNVKKLVAVPQGEGQWRLSLARYRFRYDIHGLEVVVHYCGMRREATYR
jgi:hypothetical protein